jgi:transposase-like protein
VREWIACGASTRDVVRLARTCFRIELSAGAVSTIVARLDRTIARFHVRPLTHGYRYVHLDAKHGYTSHKRKRRGRGKKKKAVLLLAWGRRHDGAEELIDFCIADSESERTWGAFLTDLEGRGLTRRNRWNQTLDLVVTDGDGGLLAALAMVYPTVPKQRCIFHKVQNITEHLRDRGHRKAILDQAGAIYHDLRTPGQAFARLRAWQRRWAGHEPEAVRTFTYEFEDTLTYLNTPAQDHPRVKTNNPIERFIKELNRKIKAVGIFPSSQSWERCTWLLWEKLKASHYAPTVPPKHQNLFTHIY